MDAEWMRRREGMPETYITSSIIIHLIADRNFSRPVINEITKKLNQYETFEEKTQRKKQMIKWLEDPEVTEEEFLRRLEKQE